jgi:hypothetical protein
MITEDIDDLRGYRNALTTYSTEEVEDAYFHIDILNYPLRYQLLQIEMQRRRLTPPTEHPPPIRTDLALWLASRPRLAEHPVVRSAIFAVALATASMLATIAALVPVWLFAVPWDFRGIQAGLVYIGYIPVAPVIGAMTARRLGARRWFALPVLFGVAFGLLLFNLTGTPALIMRDLLTTSNGGGGGISFGF